MINKTLIKSLTVFIWLVLYISQYSNAQLTQIKSIEIEMASTGSKPEFNVLTLESGGFLLEERNDAEFGKRTTSWTIKKYSDNLDLIWTAEIPIDYDSDPALLNITKDTFYQSFTISNNTKIKILKIDLDKGDFDWIEGDLIGIQEISQLKM